METEIVGVIYCITNLINGKQYVGQTRQKLELRIKGHQKNKRSLMGRALRKYGLENFKIEILEECSTNEQLDEREKFWIAEKKSLVPNGYNLTEGGRKGIVFSKESKLKNSVAQKGKKRRKHTPETKARMSAAHKGKIVSPESREKNAAAHRGKKRSPESIAKQVATMKGKKRSLKTRAKISEFNKKYWASHPNDKRRRRKYIMRFSSASVYQIYPKSFADSNGDGIGDIRGIINKLDYIKSLGADYIWTTPFYASPMKDGGYDISDYRAVNPMFGTMADVEELIAEADKRGIKIIADFVLNHCSTSHEWFQRALKGEEKYLNYFIFKDGTPDKPPTNWVSKFGGNAWEYVPHLKKWYLHLFDVSQADLNWDNPEVREELKDVLRFWLKKGIKGGRFDVVNLIDKSRGFVDDNEGDGRRFYTDGPRIHEYLKELVRDSGIDGFITVGEMSSTSIDNCIKYSGANEHELSMVFHFQHLKVDYLNGDKWALMPADIGALKKLFEDWQIAMSKADAWDALFWCNHDQPRAVSRFGDDGKYWKESAKMLAATIHLMRGTPYIYQGEELGMTNAKYTSIEQYRDVESLNYYKILIEQGKSREEALKIIGERSRDNGRTPMQWTADKFAGFSTVDSWITPPDNYEKINVEAEEKDPDSILNFYKMLVKFRKENEIVQEGDINFFERENNDVIAYRRTFNAEELIVLCNYRGVETSLQDKTLFAYTAEGYKKIIGNYDGLAENLRPFEVVVLKK